MSFKAYCAYCAVALTLFTSSLILCAEDKAAKQPYRQMDYGPSLNWTYQVAGDHIVYKGIAVQVDDAAGGIGKGHAWMVFDHDTLSMAAAWVTPEGSDKAPFIDWKGVAFDSSHSSHPFIAGKTVFVNRPGPGYAYPANGSFDDPRYVSPVDHKMYGPIPREWAHFQGLYRSENKVVIAYTVGKTSVLELPGYDRSSSIFSRTFYIEKNVKPLILRVAPETTAADRQHILAVPCQTQFLVTFLGAQIHAVSPANLLALTIVPNPAKTSASRALLTEKDARTSMGFRYWRVCTQCDRAAGRDG